MKNKLNFLAGILIIGIIGLTGINSVSSADNKISNGVERKIVVFKPGVSEEIKDAAIQKYDGVKIKNLKLVNGRTVLLSQKAEKALKNESDVLRIDDDVEIFALGEILPWGIDRIDAEKVWPSGNTADNIKVAVIDTGVSLSHPDLAANIKGGYNAINPLKSANDDNGHGSHVAGIIGAVDNEIGVIGAGPQIDIYAVKVLNRRGSGYLSDVIEGLDWAINNNMRVVNMSLGTTADILSFREAIQRVNAAGITQVAAAGNDGGSVNYPAAYSEVIAVSAVDKNNIIASWSSRGPEIDLTAPGVSIYSTYKDTGYKTLSGTSMAAPHVAGVAALVINTSIASSTYDLNGNGVWDPSEVQQKLQDTAVDLGDFGFDDIYGWGLVNAYNAVQP